MYISKTVVSFSSITGSWQSGKRITKSADLNGSLLEVVLPKHTSTAKALHLYRGSTALADKLGILARSTKERSCRLYGVMNEGSSGSFVKASTNTIRFPWVFANQKLVVCGATQTGGTLTIYVDGTVSSTQV